MQEYPPWRKNAAKAAILSKIYIFLRLCKKEVSEKPYFFLRYEVWSSEDANTFMRTISGDRKLVDKMLQGLLSIWKLGSVVDTRAGGNGGAHKKTLVVNVVQTFSLALASISILSKRDLTKNDAFSNFLKYKPLLTNEDGHAKRYEDNRPLYFRYNLYKRKEERGPPALLIDKDKDMMIVLKRDFNGTPTKFQLLNHIDYFMTFAVLNAFLE